MKLIETKTLVSAAASIEFTSIPQDGTDLVVVALLRSNRASPDTEDSGKVEFNNSSSNFSWRRLRGDGSNANSGNGTDNLLFQNQNAGGTTANTFSSVQMYISNYTLTINKSFSVDSVNENNATLAWSSILAGLWSNTSAITSIKVLPNVGTQWVAGSTISLYKITKGSDGITTVS
jgi:hypothetical protein